MRRPSGFVLFLLLSVLALAMSAGVVFVYATRLPDPATADLRGLLRWLVTRDLSQEPVETQDQLLARLEIELRGGLSLDPARDQLTDQQRAQLLQNADFLGRRWFLKQVDRYFAQIDVERLQFLDKQIDDIQRSGIAETLAALMADDSSAKPTNLWLRLNERIQRWMARLEPRRKVQAEQFVAAVQGNLLLRAMRESFGSRG